MRADHTAKNVGFFNDMIVVQLLDGGPANALVETVPPESLMHPPLSARQEQCLRLTAFRTDKEIAVYLGISEATVKKHVHEACQRLGVNRRKAALALMDPIVLDETETPRADATVGYPKQPMALRGIGDHALTREGQGFIGSDGRGTATAGNPEGSITSDPDRTRLGYRVPPGNPVLRVVLVFVLTIVLAALVVTLVVMLGNMHEAVGKIDAAGTAG